MTCSRCNRLACGASSCVMWKLRTYRRSFRFRFAPSSLVRSVNRRSSSFPFRSVRSSLHSSGAHLTASLQGANRCVGVPPPTPPLMGIRRHLFQPSALRSCHVAADAVIQDTPLHFLPRKFWCRYEITYLCTSQDREANRLKASCVNVLH